MGTDIHIFTEKKNLETGVWEYYFENEINIPTWWYAEILEEKFKQGVHEIMFPDGSLSEKEQRNLLENTYKNMSIEEVKKNFFDNSLINLTFFENNFKNNDVIRLCSRNYELFSLLANVRGMIDHSVTVKGLPKDISFRAKNYFKYLENDIHSESWCSFYDFVKAIKKIKDSPYDTKSHYLQWLNTFIRKEDQKHIRFVFGFDN